MASVSTRPAWHRPRGRPLQRSRPAACLLQQVHACAAGSWPRCSPRLSARPARAPARLPHNAERKSKRARKGRAPIRVDSATPLDTFKALIWEALGVHPLNAQLFLR